jgi:D-mannonate dehydratase
MTPLFGRPASGSIGPAAHLEGDIDMVALIDALLTEERRRADNGRADATFPFRPDHGHELLSDIGRGSHPGYPLIGRLRGLAELRGIAAALTARASSALSLGLRRARAVIAQGWAGTAPTPVQTP